MRRLFDVNPARKRTTIFHYDDQGHEDRDQVILESRSDVTDIVKYNVAKQNENNGRWGDLAHVARIPADIWAQLEREGIAQDDKALDKWLMDPARSKFRTKLGNL